MQSRTRCPRHATKHQVSKNATKYEVFKHVTKHEVSKYMQPRGHYATSIARHLSMVTQQAIAPTKQLQGLNMCDVLSLVSYCTYDRASLLYQTT